jgi:nucleoside-diphosphate-sugar epimerase
VKLFCFGLGYCALRFIEIREDVLASGTVRKPEKATALTHEGIAAFAFDGVRADRGLMPHLASAEALLISISPEAQGDPVLARFTHELTRRQNLKRLIYLSTIGVYGDQGGDWIDETSEASSHSERGQARIIAERQWLALGETLQIPVHILRLAGIYGPGRNLLLKLREGEARRIVKPGQKFNRTHVDDVAQAIGLTLGSDGPGAIWNVADDEPAPPQDVIAYAAGLLDMPPPPEQPFDTAVMTPMARSFYADNKCVSIEKIKRELGFRPIYPTYREGLRALAEAGEGRLQ